MDDDRQFHALFVASIGSRQAFTQYRKFTGIDMCHTHSALNYVLTVNTGLDANDALVIFSYGLLRVENTANWTWWMEHSRVALVGLNREDSAVISDRQKVRACSALGGRVTR